MIARCKFTIDKVVLIPYSNAPGEVEVSLTTDYDPEDPEDTRFSIYTPCGNMKFIVNNPNVVPEMIEGRSFYVDLTPCDPAGGIVTGPTLARIAESGPETVVPPRPHVGS